MFKLSPTSQKRLYGVHPDLIRVVCRALDHTTVDFTVNEGVRSLETQKRYVAAGKSQTMKSKHLKQPDGYGHAVDLVAVVGGKVTWDEAYYYPIMAAVAKASHELRVNIRMGACWRNTADVAADEATMKRIVANYVAECKRAGKRPFLDFVHFEIA